MSTVYPETYDGQNNVTRGAKIKKRPGETDLATFQRELAGDLAALLTALQTLTDKLDADAPDTGGDSDYRATLDGILTTVSTIAG